MKWLPPAGSTQHSSCGRYCIVAANSKDWIAYEMHATTAKELAVKPTDHEARDACDEYDDMLIAARKRA